MTRDPSSRPGVELRVPSPPASIRRPPRPEPTSATAGRRGGRWGALIGLAAVVWTSPLSAQRAAVRDAGRILAFPVAGVSLDTPVDEARAILEADGFIEVSIYGSPAAPAGWNYEKDLVRVELRHTAGVLTLVERTEQGRADSDTVDVAEPARLIRSYFELTDADCRIVDASMSCSVADAATRPAVVATAQLVPYRTILRATRLRVDGVQPFLAPPCRSL